MHRQSRNKQNQNKFDYEYKKDVIPIGAKIQATAIIETNKYFYF